MLTNNPDSYPYWMLACTDDGELVYTPTVGERPGVGYVDALRLVSPCRHPLPVNEDIRMRAIGQPQILAGFAGTV